MLTEIAKPRRYDYYERDGLALDSRGLPMLWITATDLTQWSEKRISQQELSIIVRRLIAASCRSIVRLRFPGGDSVVLPGWDGILECKDAPFPVPSGTSVWEFGTSKDVLAKAETDFRKR